MRRLLLLLVLVGLTAAAPARAGDAPPNRLGMSAGLPHTLAICYERRVVGPLHLQGSMGTIVIFSSGQARALVTTQGRLQPYAYLGGGALYAIGTDTGKSKGWTGFGWWGLGLRIRFGRLFLFGEWSHLDGLNTSNGYDSTEDAPGVGILWAF